MVTMLLQQLNCSLSVQGLGFERFRHLPAQLYTVQQQESRVQGSKPCRATGFSCLGLGD